MSDDDYDKFEEWRSYLTPELRAKFDQYGETLVERQVNDHRFQSAEKRRAAIVWMKERREKRTRTETIRFWVIVVFAAGSFVASLIGIAVIM